MIYFVGDGAPFPCEPDPDAPLGEIDAAEPPLHCFDVMECDMCPRFPCDEYMIYT